MSVEARDRNGVCVACGAPREAAHHAPGCAFASPHYTREELAPGFASDEERSAWEWSRYNPAFAGWASAVVNAPSYHYHLSHDNDEPHTDHVHVNPNVVRALDDVDAESRRPAEDSVGLFQQVPAGARRRPTDGYTMSDLAALKQEIWDKSRQPHLFLTLHTQEGVTVGVADNQPKEENTMESFAEAERRRQATERVQVAQERLAKARAKLESAQERTDKWEEKAGEAEAELRRATDAADRLTWPAEPQGRPRVAAKAGYLTGEPAPRVVTFSRRIGGRDYSYAAVGVQNVLQDRFLWYVTGNRDHRGQAMAWAELLEWMGRSGRQSLAVVTQVQKAGQ